MSSGGGGNSGTQTTKVELPAWIEGAGASNLASAQNYVANTPYTPYTGDRIG